MQHRIFLLPNNDEVLIGDHSSNILDGGFLRRLGLSELFDVIMEQALSVCFLIEENFLLRASLLIQHAIEDAHDDVTVEPHSLPLRIRYLVVGLHHVGTEFYVDGLLALIQKF
jgi:hypothetical protein